DGAGGLVADAVAALDPLGAEELVAQGGGAGGLGGGSGGFAVGGEVVAEALRALAAGRVDGLVRAAGGKEGQAEEGGGGERSAAGAANHSFNEGRKVLLHACALRRGYAGTLIRNGSGSSTGSA